MAKVYVFFADGFEEIEGITVVDILRRADQEVSMVSIGKELDVRGSKGIKITADVLIEEIDFAQADMLVLPGGMPGTKHLGENQLLCEELVKFAAAGKKIGAICAAPTVLGKLGLLEGKRAACYPGAEEQLKGAAVVKERVVVDGNIITSRGAGTAIPFALELTASLEGEVKALQIKKNIVYGHEMNM